MKDPNKPCILCKTRKEEILFEKYVISSGLRDSLNIAKKIKKNKIKAEIKKYLIILCLNNVIILLL